MPDLVVLSKLLTEHSNVFGMIMVSLIWMTGTLGGAWLSSRKADPESAKLLEKVASTLDVLSKRLENAQGKLLQMQKLHMRHHPDDITNMKLNGE
jgi:hypothetical protein